MEIEGFRAFRDHLNIDIDDNLTIIYGPPGSGKTSFLKSIEFALFGTTREVVSRSLRREDLINDFCDRAFVSLVLLDEVSGEIRVERVIERKGDSKLRVIQGTSEFLDEQAEEFLRSKLGCTLEEFITYISLGHAELYSLIYSSPATRDRLIDKLLGLNEVKRFYGELGGRRRDVKIYIEALKGESKRFGGEKIFEEIESLEIDLSSLLKKKDEIQEELKKLEIEKEILEDKKFYFDELLDKLRNLLDEKEKYERILKSIGGSRAAKYPRVDKEYLLAYAEDVKHRLADLLEELYMKTDADAMRSEVEAHSTDSLLALAKSYLKKIGEYILKLEYDVRDAHRDTEDLEEEIKSLEDELSENELKIKSLQDGKMEYERIIKKYGNREEIFKKITQIEVQLKTMYAEKDKCSCVKVLQDGILSSLKNQGTAQCPVCGTLVNSAVNLPKVESPESLKRRVDEIEKELKELRSASEKVSRLEPDLRMLLEHEERGRELREFMDSKLEELEDARTKANELESRLENIKSKFNNLQLMVEKLESLINIYEINEVEDKLNKINNELIKNGYDEVYYKKLLKDIENINNKIYELKGRLDELNNNENKLLYKINMLKLNANNLMILKEKLKKAERLYNSLEEIRIAIKRAHMDLRQKLVNKLTENINLIFNSLNFSKEYLDVKVEIETEAGGRGHYIFYIRRAADSSYVPVITRLSDGQRALLTLSLILALSKLKTHRCSFLLLDDPIPNIDDSVKIAIVKELREKGVSKQIILSTQSRQLASELKSLAKVYDLTTYTKTY
ncbi:MAG: AAA family ATPase [Thermofilaceae archaeon]